jgi:TRAP-type C4-dicarboxylate transport system permease small subunit
MANTSEPAAAEAKPVPEANPALPPQAHVEETFPNDGPISAALRRLDRTLGTGEQVLLFSLLALVVLVATVQAITAHAFSHQIEWAFYIVRGGVFAIALLGAAFASHQQRHLAMDLVSRRLSPRGRLILRVFLGVVTLFMAVLLVRAGMHLTRSETHVEHASTFDWLTDVKMGFVEWLTLRMIAIGAALIAIHTAIHLVIDCDYLARRQLPPERARSGH